MLIRQLNNGFKLEDWTEELNIIKRPKTLLQDLGIFRKVSVAADVVSFERKANKYGLIGDVTRGGAIVATQDVTRDIHTYKVPYFKVIDRLQSQDIRGVRGYGQTTQAISIFEALNEKMNTMLYSAEATQEWARFQAITQGKIYAPNGTVTHTSFYDDFGVTRKVVNFELSTPATKPQTKIEEVIRHIQDKVEDGEPYRGVYTLCSTQFFTALITHPAVELAFSQYSSTQEPFRNRLGGDTTEYRRFVWHGMEFIEVAGGIGANKFIPDGEAYAIAKGTRDTFLTYVAPSNKLDLVNTLGEDQYLFAYDDPKGEGKELELEFSHVNLVRRPDSVIKLTMA